MKNSEVFTTIRDLKNSVIPRKDVKKLIENLPFYYKESSKIELSYLHKNLEFDHFLTALQVCNGDIIKKLINPILKDLRISWGEKLNGIFQEIIKNTEETSDNGICVFYKKLMSAKNIIYEITLDEYEKKIKNQEIYYKAPDMIHSDENLIKSVNVSIRNQILEIESSDA